MITSLPYSRRCVLRTVGAGLFGTAATTLIVACSRNQQTHATSDPSVSQYVRSDFSGEVAFESFNTSAGSYVPANAEHPAQNVPVPIKTENMGKNSIAGFYDTIGYLNAALNYLLATGDTNPLEVITINPEFTKALLLFTDETGESQAAKSWYVSPQATLSLNSRERLSKRLAIHPRYQFGRAAGRQFSDQCNTCRAAEIPLCGYYPRHLRERSLVPHAHSS